jgi:hypothetical protein
LPLGLGFLTEVVAGAPTCAGQLRRIVEAENISGNVMDLCPIEDEVGHVRMRHAQEGGKRHCGRRWHSSDGRERRHRIATGRLFLGIDEMAAAARGLRYPLPSRYILSASGACCEEGGGGDEENPGRSRLHKAAPWRA